MSTDSSDGPAARSGIMSAGFIKLFVGFFFAVLDLNLFALVPYYLERRGASELLYGAAAGMTGIGGVVAMALLGGRTDLYTRKRFVLRILGIACVGNVLSLVAMALHPAWYLVVTGLEGAMAGVGLPVMFVWASELSPPERRTQAFAWLGIAGLIGDSLGPLLAESLLLTQPDPRAPSAFMVVFLAANLLWPVSVGFFVAAPDARATGDGDRAGLTSLLALPEMRAALLGVAAFGGALGVMMSLGKNFVASVGLPLVSILLGGHTLGALTSRLALPWLLSRFERAAIIAVGFSGVALAMVLLSVTRSDALLALSGVTYGLSHGLLFPTLLSRSIDFGGAHAAGRISTLYMGMFGLGFGLAPAAGGVVLGVTGFPVLFRMVALTCLAGLALVRLGERRHRGRLQAAR